MIEKRRQLVVMNVRLERKLSACILFSFFICSLAKADPSDEIYRGLCAGKTGVAQAILSNPKTYEQHTWSKHFSAEDSNINTQKDLAAIDSNISPRDDFEKLDFALAIITYRTKLLPTAEIYLSTPFTDESAESARLRYLAGVSFERGEDLAGLERLKDSFLKLPKFPSVLLPFIQEDASAIEQLRIQEALVEQAAQYEKSSERNLGKVILLNLSGTVIFDSVTTELRNLHVSCPKDIYYKTLYAESAFNAGQFQQAGILLTQLVDELKYPGPFIKSLYGLAMLELGEFDKAETAFDGILSDQHLREQSVYRAAVEGYVKELRERRLMDLVKKAASAFLLIGFVAGGVFIYSHRRPKLKN